MSEDDTWIKQDGGAIFDALASIEGMPEREQPAKADERDWASFDQGAAALSQAERRALIEHAAGSLARDDGRDMTQELLDERRKEAEDKDWLPYRPRPPHPHKPRHGQRQIQEELERCCLNLCCYPLDTPDNQL